MHSRFIYIIIFCLSFASCNFAQKQETRQSINKPDFYRIAKDTLVTYDIEGISTEGAEAKVNYVNGKITKSITNIYAGTGQASVVYEFDTDKIKVLETKNSYKTEIENVKSDKDMKLEYKRSYFIDYSGNLIGESIPDRIDIFQEFKKIIPFELK
ncbi:MAG: hypothetical protein LBP34_08620 [Flavobacteriaceae bacterium]|jgi:hypothetical protein|nr:hypothetical protein [Flavobacteriaceae bacterium]